MLFKIQKFFLATCLISISFISNATNQRLNIYNWSDFIAPETIPVFEKQTNITVYYDVYDSNELLDGKLMAGSTGYDLVVPTDAFLARQIKADIYLPLDKSRLSNYHHLDAKFLKMMEKHDPNNQYAIPYMWQATAIGYNVDKVKAVLGDDFIVDSWDILLQKENIEKLSQCGVAFLDAPSAVFPIVLNYLGKDPNSRDPDEYAQATTLLQTIRPYVTYFHSSKYINDLADGDICITIGHSGDVLQAKHAAEYAKNGVNIEFVTPKEGAIISFDNFAIPKDAKNVDEAYLFLDYLMEPEVIANISNQLFFPSINKDAYPYMDEAVRDNPLVYPPEELIDSFFPILEQPHHIDQLMSRLWTRILSGI